LKAAGCKNFAGSIPVLSVTMNTKLQSQNFYNNN
jgi:hypothetical protein